MILNNNIKALFDEEEIRMKFDYQISKFKHQGLSVNSSHKRSCVLYHVHVGRFVDNRMS